MMVINMNEQIDDLMSEYFSAKDLARRYTILKKFAVQYPKDAKDFFSKAFKKERYLDMKVTALRGYAHYASEEEVTVLAKKALELLKKRPLHTPYDYQEYEPMRSVFLLPYLIQKYHYVCFDELSEQLEKQYNDMPDCFKDIFTLDENGNAYMLRDSEEVSGSIREFLDSKK